MLLTIHDANLQKIGFIDNEKQETLNFYDDTWTRNLETASSTFEFTVSKKELLGDTANQPLYNQLNERSFISFKHNGQTYLFNIMKVEENERWVRCYCENLNLELINEYTNAYKAEKAMSFAEYLNAFDIPQFAMVTLGVNEVSDQKKTLEWEGQDTKLARLLSLANKFNAEVEFVTRLNDDSSIKQLVLNIYHQADDSHTGVGRIRSDIRLTFEKNIKSMTRKVDKTEIYTMIVPYGKAKEQPENGPEVRVYIGGLPAWEEKNDKGIVIFKQEGNCLYAPHAANLYPSTFGASTQENKWIRKDLEVDSDDPKVIRAAGIANLRKNAYPAITYEVDGFVDVEIGDTITIHDKGFVPSLDVRARAIEQKISFSNPANNTTTFGNFKELENRTSGDLRTVFERMVENSRPYSILFSTDNGVIFKNNTGQSTLRPTLKRGNQIVNATYRFVIDGSIVGAGLTYTVNASKITKPTVITVSAWVGEKEVASDEITFVGVSDGLNGRDGRDGIPGKAGADGRTPYVHFAYADSADGRTGFSLTQDGNKRYFGHYSDYEKSDSPDPTKYKWMDTFSNFDFGTRNLLANTQTLANNATNSNTSEHWQDFIIARSKAAGAVVTQTSIVPLTGKEYILSFYAKASKDNYPIRCHFFNPSTTITVLTSNGWKSPSVADGQARLNISTEWKRYWVKYTQGPTDSIKTVLIGRHGSQYDGGDNNTVVEICAPALYEGHVVKDWSPAFEDVQNQINSKADSVLTQAQLNKLNEVNSVVQAELEAKASLDTLNQWVKAYQDFVNANNANRAQAEKNLADASARVAKLENDLNDMSERWNFIDSYMTSSNEGLVIGKTDNSSSMLFSPNGRISMLSAGNEVMYISQGVIHIENGIFSKTIQIGRYREEQDFINPDRNVIRYVGGS